ncbi:hypothetical protein ACH4E7_40660 [Kitasatospora sp. NPDC018058]|uniref:RapZ C-terminal domain-containing protein n=1 Tax=Kitasatospora sp. NPDC018058 TaxID=3364025 RepID=UPI0037BE72E9
MTAILTPPDRQPPGLVKVQFHSVGTLHPGAITEINPGLYYDLTRALSNPFDDPQMRHLTGLEPEVRDHVFATPGADTWAEHIITETRSLLAVADPAGRLVHVTLACRGGRHRSVVLCERAAQMLRDNHETAVEVIHHHVLRPVVLPPERIPHYDLLEMTEEVLQLEGARLREAADHTADAELREVLLTQRAYLFTGWAYHHRRAPGTDV